MKTEFIIYRNEEEIILNVDLIIDSEGGISDYEAEDEKGQSYVLTDFEQNEAFSQASSETKDKVADLQVNEFLERAYYDRNRI
jgi:hypothetical protein